MQDLEAFKSLLFVIICLNPKQNDISGILTGGLSAEISGDLHFNNCKGGRFE